MLYSLYGSGFIKLVLVSLNKLISSDEPSTLIKLFIIPEKVISPPVVLTRIVVGLNNFNNSGSTVLPLINPVQFKEYELNKKLERVK